MSDLERRSVELRQREAAERLVVRRLHVLLDGDGDRLAELVPLDDVAAPVDPGHDPCHTDVEGQFVELAADGQRRAVVVLEAQAVRARLYRVWDHEALVEDALSIVIVAPAPTEWPDG